MRREILLNFGHIIHQVFGRSEVDNQFTIGQRGIGYITYQIITSGRSSYGSRDMRNLRTGFQVSFNLFQVARDTREISSFRQFILHIKLVVHHIRKKSLPHKTVAESGKYYQYQHGKNETPAM